MATTRGLALASRAPVGAIASRRRRFRRLVLVALVLLAGVTVYAGLLARDVWQETMAGQAALRQGMAILTGNSHSSLRTDHLTSAAMDFQSAERSFAAARSRLGPWGNLAVTYGDLLPGRARQLQAVAPLLDFAREAAGMAATLSQGLRPVALATQGGAGNDSPLLRIGPALEQAQPSLIRAQRQLSLLRAARRRLIGLPLPGSIAPLLASFDRQEPALSLALTIARGLPALLGAEGPRSYLVIYQDSADLRATGGYIGSAALINLNRGRLSQIDYEDSKELQVPPSRSIPAPAPLFYYEDFGSLELRDANFWPDFPTSARQIAHIYQMVTGHHLDGVVAVQPPLVSDLLRGLGPLAVPDFHEVVTAANVVERIEYYTHDSSGAQSNPHRKRFIVALNHALLRALLHAGAARLAGLLPHLQSAFADRVIVASVADPPIAQALSQAHWDGSLRTDRGDYLAIFDQNVTDSKLNPFIDERIEYDVQCRPDGGLDSRVTIAYHSRIRHTAIWIPRTDYQDYLRVAVPTGSQVHDQTGYIDTFWPDEMERDRRLVAGYVEIPPGATRSVVVSYGEPASTLSGIQGYRLLVQKQPGSPPAAITVRASAWGKTWVAHAWLVRDTVFSTSWHALPGTMRVSDATTLEGIDSFP